MNALYLSMARDYVILLCAFSLGLDCVMCCYMLFYNIRAYIFPSYTSRLPESTHVYSVFCRGKE